MVLVIVLSVNIICLFTPKIYVYDSLLARLRVGVIGTYFTFSLQSTLISSSFFSYFSSETFHLFQFSKKERICLFGFCF